MPCHAISHFQAYKVKTNVVIYGAALSACEQSSEWPMAMDLVRTMYSEARTAMAGLGGGRNCMDSQRGLG